MAGIAPTAHDAGKASAFHGGGYIALPSLVTEADLESLRGDVATALQAPLPPGCSRPHNTLVPLRWGDPPVTRTLSLPGVVERISAAVAAEDPRWISGYVSLKEPRSPPLWWHQDWWCWDHPATFAPNAPQVAVLCYLGDTDASSGALRFLPGSHRRSIPLHARLPETTTADVDLEHPAMRDHETQRTLPARAGDAIVLDYRLGRVR